MRQSAGPADTEAIGAALAACLAPGDVVFLLGELGAGKSTLVRAAGRALGVEGPMPSPTFTVVQLHRGRVPVAHLDAYRMEGGADDEDAELLADAVAGAVAFVEWPRSIAHALPAPRLTVLIEHGGGDRRLVHLTAHDAAMAACLEPPH